MIVPDKTIAFYTVPELKGIEYNIDDISIFLKPLNKSYKRDWFNSNFYKCLPLSIGNMQGFVFSVPFDFEVEWDGGNSPSNLNILLKNSEKYNKYIQISSGFGYGIFTIHFPLILKTPPKTNLMTIAPPNFPTPGITPMTGMIETDNLKFTFTLNFKVDFINTKLLFLANSPLMGIIPIPRHFCDSFELKNAYDIFDSDTIEKEKNIVKKHGELRKKMNSFFSHKQKKYKSDSSYFKGEDILGNKFIDHQLPKEIK